MKRIWFLIILLIQITNVNSQGLVYVDGTVTDLVDSLPVVNHPVTILADSANGIAYYSVVFTDSAGYYYDEIPVMPGYPGVLMIQTPDCNNVQLEVIFAYDSVNTSFTHHFRICTINSECQALYSFYPEPQGSPDSFQFQDLSTGSIISWFWDFGDGTFSQEQNPFHIFPGPGTFETCLTVTGNNCSDIFCSTFVISDTVYQQIYGQVFAGNFPLQTGTVTLFALNPSGGYYPLREGFPVDSNGIYFFSLVPEGTYLVQAVPEENMGFLPTYFGDVMNWQQASQIVLGEPENPYNIHLIMAGQTFFGPGSMSGRINSIAERTTVDKINMILMNENGSAIGFSKVNSQGVFDFQDLEYGVYYLRAELSGVYSDNMSVEITPEKPQLDIILSLSGSSILDVENIPGEILEVNIYPNPVSDRLIISYNSDSDSELDILIFSGIGQQLYRKQEIVSCGDNLISIPFGRYTEGIYTVTILNREGARFLSKIIKMK